MLKIDWVSITFLFIFDDLLKRINKNLTIENVTIREVLVPKKINGILKVNNSFSLNFVINANFG